MNKKVLVFGVFDGLHEGHRYFLKQASKIGDLTAVIAPDKAVWELKHKMPHYPEKRRLSVIRKLAYIQNVVAGDSKKGEYSIFKSYIPDVICLGYDQGELEEDLKKWLIKNNLNVEIIKVEPHEPEKFKSSIINTKPFEK